MNLTYEVYHERGAQTPEVCSACHAMVAKAYASAKSTGASGAQLGGLFSKVVDSVKRTITHPLEIAKASIKGPKAVIDVYKSEAQAVKGDIRDMGPVAAPVLSLFGPIGMAAGAVVGGLSQKFRTEAARKKATLEQAAQASDPNTLLNEYKSYIGQAPGRVYGIDVMLQVLRAAFAVGALRARGGASVDPAIADKIFFQGNPAINCDNWDAFVRDAVSKGANNAQQILNVWFALPWVEGGSCGSNSPWSDSSLARQIVLDAFDAFLVKYNPNAPASYGVSASDYEQLASTSNTPVANPPAATVQTAAQAPPGYFLNQAGAAPETSASVDKLLAQMQSQGANQQQMLAAAMNALTQKGVNTSAPGMQEAIKTEVATAGISSVNPLILGGLGALGLLFALARPARGGKSNRAAFASRRRNPRKRRSRR